MKDSCPDFPEGGVWDVLRSDEIFNEFLRSDLEDAAAATSNKVATGLNIAEHLRKLTECISLIDGEIHNQVRDRVRQVDLMKLFAYLPDDLPTELQKNFFSTWSIHSYQPAWKIRTLSTNRSPMPLSIQVAAHHGDLLSHATGIETLEDVLKMLHARISSLLSSLARVKTRAGDAHARISGLTRQLARMQFTCDLMRKTARVLYLRRKLTSQLPGIVVGASVAGSGSASSSIGANSDANDSSRSPDLAAAAANLFELKQLLADEELRGINVIEEDRTLAKKALKEVETRGTAILESGMSTPNQSQIASGLRVFANLDVVDAVAERIVKEAVGRIDKVAADSLSLHNLVNASSSSSAGASSGGASRTAGAPPGRAVMPIPGEGLHPRDASY